MAYFGEDPDAIKSTQPCKNCGGYCKITMFQTTGNPIPGLECEWADCTKEMMQDEADELHKAVQECAAPGSEIPPIVQQELFRQELEKRIKAEWDSIGQQTDKPSEPQ